MFSADGLCRETEGEVFQECAIKKRNLCLICRRSCLREQTWPYPQTQSCRIRTDVFVMISRTE